jgi:N-glycosyltransferase
MARRHRSDLISQEGTLMRVLCSTTGLLSHARVMIPIARALMAAGHTVLVVAPERLVQPFIEESIEAVGVGADFSDQTRMFWGEGNAGPADDFDPFDFDLWNRISCGPIVTATYEAVLPVARDFRPDVIVRDGFEYGSVLVAEALGVPQVPCPSGLLLNTDPARVLPTLNEHRETVGLAPAESPGSLYPVGGLDWMAPGYSFSPYEMPPMFSFNQSAGVSRRDKMPTWLADAPSDVPLVLASVGTTVPVIMAEVPPDLAEGIAGFQEFFVTLMENIVSALSSMDCVAVVGTGGMEINQDLAGPNVHVMDWFPQPVMLDCAQLFITHAGYAGVCEAMRAGVPMALRPLFCDQKTNAESAVDNGLGDWLNDLEPERIAEVCQQVLASDSITASARRAKRRMLALPPIEAAVAHLEQLARATTPA